MTQEITTTKNNINSEKIVAVLLCAGKGTRLAPLTDKIPKALIIVQDKPLIEYKLELLIGIVDEIIIIVGYLGNLIQEKYGENYFGIKLIYVEQKELLGTGHALIQAREHIKKKFLVMNGDDIYAKSDVIKLLKHEFAILSSKVDNPSKFGVLNTDDENNLVEIVEKPQNPISNLINIGCYLFDCTIFEYELKLSPRGEYEIIDYLKELIAKNKQIKVEKIDKYWIPVNNHEELDFAQNQKF